MIKIIYPIKSINVIIEKSSHLWLIFRENTNHKKLGNPLNNNGEE